MSGSLMRNRAITAVRLVFAAFAIFAFSAAAEAAVYISYVASNGNDANPCTVVTAPCKTLPRAVAVTSANGTVKVLTALQSTWSSTRASRSRATARQSLERSRSSTRAQKSHSGGWG